MFFQFVVSLLVAMIATYAAGQFKLSTWLIVVVGFLSLVQVVVPWIWYWSLRNKRRQTELLWLVGQVAATIPFLVHFVSWPPSEEGLVNYFVGGLICLSLIGFQSKLLEEFMKLELS